MVTMGHTDTIVEAKDVLAGSFLVLDARSPSDYRAGHAAGAFLAPVAAWDRTSKTEEGAFGNVEHWNAAIGGLGIDGSRRVAVYDDGKATDAARVWFILQYFGVPVAMVDGNWPAIRALIDQQAETSVNEPVAAKFSGKPGTGAVDLKERASLRGTLDSVQVFDARTQAEYDGTDVRNNPRGGHLPGAIRIGHTDLLDASGRLRSASELRRLLTSAGFAANRPIVTHCEGGGRAALAALAAVHAGYTDVHNYYLSFADWAQDDACPVVQ
jgi:thiosulfate/3-mercaptopyruvate sulfurtransferase